MRFGNKPLVYTPSILVLDLEQKLQVYLALDTDFFYLSENIDSTTSGEKMHFSNMHFNLNSITSSDWLNTTNDLDYLATE